MNEHTIACLSFVTDDVNIRNTYKVTGSVMFWTEIAALALVLAGTLTSIFSIFTNKKSTNMKSIKSTLRNISNLFPNLFRTIENSRYVFIFLAMLSISTSIAIGCVADNALRIDSMQQWCLLFTIECLKLMYV